MTEEELKKFWEGYIAAKNKALGLPAYDPKIETLSEYLERYFREVEAPVPEEKKSIIEIFGLTLFRKISAFFSMMWENVFTSFRHALSGIVEDITKLFFKQILTQATPGIKEYFWERIQEAKLPPDMEESLRVQLERGTPLDYIGVWVFAVLQFIIRPLSLLEAGREVARQAGYKLLQPSLPGAGDIMAARFRDKKYEEVIDDYMMRMGFNKDVREMLKIVSYSLMGTEEVKNLYLRGEIDKAERDKRLEAIGIKGEDIPLLEKLYYFIPSPGDLVTMAVKEAWDDSFASKWGTDLDFPAPFLEWAKKQGMSAYWAKKFWRAHWVLPGATQGFEMLHRGLITKDELKGLLKALDVMPLWREKLIGISYYPYTRVDVRRMYGAGVIKQEDVLRAYLDLGYDEEHARNLTRWTIGDVVAAERDLTKGEILSLYERAIIKREDAKVMITDLGYSDDETEIYLTKTEYDLAKKLKDKTLSFIGKNYVSGLLDYTSASQRLARLNLGGDEIRALFEDWDIEKEGKLADLTLPQLQSLLIQGIITESRFIVELKKMNYTNEQIDWLVKLTKKKVVVEEKSK